MTIRTRATAVMAVLLTLLPSGLLAQQAPQRPTFRAGVDLVEIDVSVVNDRGTRWWTSARPSSRSPSMGSRGGS